MIQKFFIIDIFEEVCVCTCVCVCVCVCYILPRVSESPLDIWVLHQQPNLAAGYRLVIYTKDCTLKRIGWYCGIHWTLFNRKR